MTNLAQLIGEQNLRIAQLEEALAERGGEIPGAGSAIPAVAPQSQCSRLPAFPAAAARRPAWVLVLDHIERSTCWLRAHDLVEALSPQVSAASIYNSLSQLRNSDKIARRGTHGRYEFASLTVAKESP